jgi:hypothetical protein
MEASPHTVGHRNSLAYKVFVKAAEARDHFLGKRSIGDFSPTVQRYYTGMTLFRYICLVCVEWPLVLLVSMISLLAVPGTLVYMIVHSGQYIERIGSAWCLALLAVYLLASLGAAAMLLVCTFILCSWAAREPTWIVTALKNRHHQGDEYWKDSSAFKETPEKFPGPIALFKKWILSIESGSSPNITWDTGRKGDLR